MRLLLSVIVGLLLVGAAPRPGSAQPLETIVYLSGSGADQVGSVRRHAGLISVLAPQAFGVGADGRVHGRVSPELLQAAREEGISVVPLIHNPGFDQESVHRLLDDPGARRRTIGTMVELAREHGFRGWQLDFENIHRSHRDRYSAFYREVAEAFGDSVGLSVAVVPGTDAAGATPFQRYMQDNWRGSFDLTALAEIGDFISLMTYAQHGAVTTPGPIAGLPWMREMLEHALAVGVPPEKLSLGLPWYSGYWFPDFADEAARVRGREVGFDTVSELLDRSGARLGWLPARLYAGVRNVPSGVEGVMPAATIHWGLEPIPLLPTGSLARLKLLLDGPKGFPTSTRRRWRCSGITGATSPRTVTSPYSGSRRSFGLPTAPPLGRSERQIQSPHAPRSRGRSSTGSSGSFFREAANLGRTPSSLLC